MAIKNKKKSRVLVAMSGGVDSSVAAQLLVNQGYDVAGVFLHFWQEENQTSERENKCCSIKSLLDAKAVCQKIGVPLYTLDFRRGFKKTVVDNFLSEYNCGRTPNPCVVCNKEIKIGGLLKYARAMGFDYLATGHYVKLKRAGQQFKMFRARDKQKDQSYFLYNFTPAQLKHLIFPLGSYIKTQTRQLAKKFNLPTAAKSDSQEICFIPEKYHEPFLKRHLKMQPGKIKLFDGTVIGQHDGLPLYTIGQRRGIKIGGTGPYYAAKFDYRNNDLYVVTKFDDPIFYAPGLIAEKINWLSGKAPKKSYKCRAIIRYQHPAMPGTLEKFKSNYKFKFTKSQRAVTPGQSVVFYQGQQVLGGGIIKTAI